MYWHTVLLEDVSVTMAMAPVNESIIIIIIIYSFIEKLTNATHAK